MPGRSPESRRRGSGRNSDLQIDENVSALRWVWAFERAGWVLMGLVVAAGLLGLFGTGPLSTRSAVDLGGPLRLDYERFGRFMKSTTLTLHLGKGVGRGGEARVWFDRAYLARFGLQEVTPQPTRVEAVPGRLVFVFAVADASSPALVAFDLQPERAGEAVGRVGLESGGVIRFRQLIYP